MPRRCDGDVGQRGERGQHRGQLAGVVQVGVQPADLAGAVHGQAVLGRGGRRRPSGRAGRAARRRPGWCSAGQPGLDLAAGHQGGGQERRGVGQVRLDLTSSGADRARRRPASWCRPESSTDTPPSRSASTVIAMCGCSARPAPTWCTSQALVEPGAGQQQRGDELGGGRGVDRHAAAAEPAGAVHGERQAAAAGVVHLDAEPGAARRSAAPIGRSRARGSPSKRIGPSASAATGGRKRITVPARPQSTGPPRSAAGRDQPVRRRPSSTPTPRPRSAVGHQQGVPGAQRGAEPGRAVGQRRQHQGAVGQRLRAGQRDRGVTGPSAGGAGHGRPGGCACAVTPSVRMPDRPGRRPCRTARSVLPGLSAAAGPGAAAGPARSPAGKRRRNSASSSSIRRVWCSSASSLPSSTVSCRVSCRCLSSRRRSSSASVCRIDAVRVLCHQGSFSFEVRSGSRLLGASSGRGGAPAPCLPRLCPRGRRRAPLPPSQLQARSCSAQLGRLDQLRARRCGRCPPPARPRRAPAGPAGSGRGCWRAVAGSSLEQSSQAACSSGGTSTGLRSWISPSRSVSLLGDDRAGPQPAVRVVVGQRRIAPQLVEPGHRQQPAVRVVQEVRDLAVARSSATRSSRRPAAGTGAGPRPSGTPASRSPSRSGR